MTGITRAVLLAAGRGKRLGDLTASFPKAMLEVGGVPILHRIISGLAGAGIREITVVTSHAAEVVEAETGDGTRWGVAVRYRRQPAPDGTARALALAREDVDGAPFFVGWGDIVVQEPNYRRLLEAAREAGAALAVNEVDDPFAGGAVYVDERGMATRLVEKPPRGASHTRWNNAGLLVLPPEIWPFVDAVTPSPRGEYELPQAVAGFLAAGHAMRAVPIEGPWFDVGTPETLAAARLHFGG